KGEGFAARVRTLLRLPKSLIQARSLLDAFDPDAVFGIGGYNSGPVVLAAWMRGVPRGVLAANAIPGVTNRGLPRLANRIFISFPEAERFFVKSKTRRTGTPVRKKLSTIGEVRELRSKSGFAGFERGGMGGAGGPPMVIMVLGGSQGATALN